MKNFGLIKNCFNSILSENIGRNSTEVKALFKSYLKLIKENEILKTQFLIYKNIEDKIELSESNAVEFVKQNIALMSKFSNKEIKEANNLLESKIPSSFKLEEAYVNEELKDLHENISKLILTNKSASNIDEIVEATLDVAKYINKNEARVITEDLGIPNSLLSNIAVDKFNEKYETLDESYKTAVKLIMESDIKARGEFFSESVKTCLGLINTKLKDSDSTVKESLLAAKENLLGREFNDETFVKDISKILELSEDLK